MYKKPHILDPKEFLEWKETQRVLYASDNGDKRLWCYLNGRLEVEKNGEVIWMGMQPFAAIEAYNEA